MTLPAIGPPPPASRHATPDHDALRTVARELEASFLSEMLGQAGFGEGRGAFGGGVGEAQMASLLRTEHARAMVERGGIGLSESLFRALLARGGAGP